MEREKLISLVTAAQSGDNGALNELFNAFYNDVYYFALKTVKDDELACDITQEAFVEILRTISNLQEPAAFVKWMKQITYHQCTRYFKKKKDVIVDEDADGNTIFDTVQEDKADFIPDEALDKDEFKKTILLMLDELSEEQRAAVLLFYYDELSVKQIAEIQGVSENTVKSRLNYARKGIKKSVEDYEEKHGVKLHGLTALPLLRWVLGDVFHAAPAASAGMVAEGVSAATGVTLTITATSASTAATAAAVASAVGIGAKIAAIPLAVKVAAGIAAAIIAVGGGTSAVILSDKGEKEDAPVAHVHAYVEEVQQAAACTEDGSAVYTCSCGDTYTEALPAAHQWGEWSRQGFREYRYCPVCTQNEARKAALNTEEEILRAYTDQISWLGYFSSVDTIDALTVFKWSQCAVDLVETGEYEATDPEDNQTYTYARKVYAVSELDALTDQVFGRTWDYSVLDGRNEEHMYTYYYDAQAKTVIVDFDCRFSGAGLGIGSPYYQGYEQIGDTHFVVKYYLDYYGDEVHGNVFEVERIGDKYIIVGNYAAEDIPDDIVDATTTATVDATTTATVGATTTATGDTTTGVATNPTTGVVIGSTADSTTTATVSSGTTTTAITQNEPVTTTTAASSVDVPDNTIYTCDFENGLGNWASKGDNSTIGIIKTADLPVANADGGTQALKFAYGMKYEYCVDKSAFVVEPDTTYQLTFDVLSNQPEGRIRAMVSVNSWLAEWIMNNNYYVAVDQWQTVSMTFTSGSDTNLYLGLQAMIPDVTGIFYIDNIAITKVATP